MKDNVYVVYQHDCVSGLAILYKHHSICMIYSHSFPPPSLSLHHNPSLSLHHHPLPTPAYIIVVFEASKERSQLYAESRCV